MALHSDFTNNLTKANLWKQFCSYCMIVPSTSEANKKQSNSVEHAWQDIQCQALRYENMFQVAKEHHHDIYK